LNSWWKPSWGGSRVVPCVPGQHDCDWLHVLWTAVQPTESIPVIPRGPPETQAGKVPTLSKGNMVPGAYCVATRCSHRPWETEGHAGMSDTEKQAWIKELFGPVYIRRQFICSFADIVKPLTRLTEE
jgi:hypothetical protein